MAKEIVSTYSFNATSATVTFSDFTAIVLERVYLVTNVTHNVIIYNFADTTLGGSVVTNVLTLAGSTAGMSNSDKLQIIYDAASGDPQYDTPSLAAGSATATNQTSGSQKTQIVNGTNTLAVDGSGNVGISNFPATQPVSGTVSVNALPAGSANIGGVEIIDSAGTNKLAVNASGQIAVSNLPATQPVSGSVSVSNFPATQLVSAASLPLPSNAAQETGGNLASIATNTNNIPAKGQATMANSSPVVIASNQSAVPVSGTVSVNALPTGANTIGNVGLNAGSNAIGSITNTSFGATQSGTWTVQPGNTANTTAWKVDNSAVNQPVIGSTASGASLTSAPVTAGGLAKTANPTAVADGQVVNSLHDKVGKQVVVGSIRALKGVQQTTITSSTAETAIITADATNFLDLYGLVLTNTSATTTKVTIKDATAGTTRAVFEVPATDTRGLMLGESAAIPQASNNNNWTATCGTSVASLEVTALFVKNL